MQYPLISEYISAIKDEEDNFATLTNLRPVLDDAGMPVMSSGNFAVVFKMTDGKKNYALKCFTRDVEGRKETYKKISEFMKSMEPTDYMISASYLEKELFVDTSQTDETEFPVLLMDWIDGVCLDEYVNKMKTATQRKKLADGFQKLVLWLLQQPFAHGDLKPDNIIVKSDGSLVLIDYDGMYVPSMKGQRAKEIGTPPFTHRDRTINDFNEYIDDYAAILILLILRIIAKYPARFDDYLINDSRDFLRKIDACIGDKDITVLLSIYIYTLGYGKLDRSVFSLNTMLYKEEIKQKDVSNKTNKDRIAKTNKKNKSNGHEYVDLGLPSGLKWATCNVGANTPEEYGDYYAWGETETKDEYTEENCSTLGKYMSDISGNPQYDVARRKWGSKWRMPTEAEMKELRENCIWTWTIQNGVEGYQVTGPNGNSIFLPAAGYRYGSSLYRAGSYGSYWSSRPDDFSDDYSAYYLYFGSSYHSVYDDYRFYGHSVRLVLE